LYFHRIYTVLSIVRLLHYQQRAISHAFLFLSTLSMIFKGVLSVQMTPFIILGGLYTILDERFIGWV